MKEKKKIDQLGEKEMTTQVSHRVKRVDDGPA